MFELLICLLAFILLVSFVTVRVIGAFYRKKMEIPWRPEWDSSEMDRYMKKYGISQNIIERIK